MAVLGEGLLSSSFRVSEVMGSGSLASRYQTRVQRSHVYSTTCFLGIVLLLMNFPRKLGTLIARNLTP